MVTLDIDLPKATGLGNAIHARMNGIIADIDDINRDVNNDINRLPGTANPADSIDDFEALKARFEPMGFDSTLRVFLPQVLHSCPIALTYKADIDRLHIVCKCCHNTDAAAFTALIAYLGVDVIIVGRVTVLLAHDLLPTHRKGDTIQLIGLVNDAVEVQGAAHARC